VGKDAKCSGCGKAYRWIREDQLLSLQPSEDAFYETCYEGLWRKKSSFLTRRNPLKSLQEATSLSERRRRFFRSQLKKLVKERPGRPLVLDVACGRGRKEFAQDCDVVGLDVVLSPLYDASDLYEFCVHADAVPLPFPDAAFDAIVSSDFLGHVPSERKDDLFGEFHRVLRAEGKMIHILETDANNWHFRFAHRYPDLFQKYFVEAIGGHFGLELPSRVIRRLEASGFEVEHASKICGDLWQINEYKIMFDNEYRQKSKLIRGLVMVSKALSFNVGLREATNVALNPVAAVVERRTPLDNGQGLMVVCRKVQA
jgi:ubiquinone/menaquinone biosynthesis C-methylase UbiE